MMSVALNEAGSGGVRISKGLMNLHWRITSREKRS